MVLMLILYNFATKKQYEFYESDKAKALKFTVVSKLMEEVDETGDLNDGVCVDFDA